jgi:hypothetical protein
MDRGEHGTEQIRRRRDLEKVQDGPNAFGYQGKEVRADSDQQPVSDKKRWNS